VLCGELADVEDGFGTYWPFHVAREHGRLYQAAGQSEYDLTA
jgi:hypothetical protein